MVSAVPGAMLDEGTTRLLDIDARLRDDEAAMPLPGPDPAGMDQAPPPSIQERFETFHAANPWVLHRLRALALEVVDNGHEKVGIKMLWEVLRWQVLNAPQIKGASTPKLDNSLTSRYARVLMDTTPQLVGVFDTRSLRTSA